MPKIKHFSKVHDEISRYQTEFKYCIFHTHEHLEIFYIEKGKGVFETKTQKVHIKANDIIVVNKGAVHRIYSEEEPLEYFNLATFNVQVGDNRLDTVSKGEFEKISFKSKENNEIAIPITQNDNRDRKFNSQVVYPIISQGDVVGSVILLSKDANTKMGEAELKVVQSAAGFLSSQMEI